MLSLSLLPTHQVKVGIKPPFIPQKEESTALSSLPHNDRWVTGWRAKHLVKRTSQLSPELCLATKKIAAATGGCCRSGPYPTSTLGQGCAGHKDTTKYQQQIKTVQRKLLWTVSYDCQVTKGHQAFDSKHLLLFSPWILSELSDINLGRNLLRKLYQGA